MVMAKKETGYEELRRQRLEENKKRMEELHLPRLSLALKSSFPKPSLKPSPMKRVKPTEILEGRRSGRVANSLAPGFYKDTVSYGRFDIPRRIHGYKKDLSNRVYASDEARASATLKAEELESSLGADYPTFVMPMLQSHVTRFWLGLPGYWCRRHLPKRDDTVTLIDEEGEEYPTAYLSTKSGLGGGWKGFSIAHGLVDGDALVLQLIRPTAFKVYIIRVKGFEKGSNLEDMEARASATLKAEELESNLGTDYPTFVKPMLQSHVTGEFWLGLPGYWCRRHLPNRAGTVTLIDEEGEEYPTAYLSTKSGLSGGWRGFSIAHGLVDGDALVFQLIRPTAFKVYIIRVKGFEKGRNLKDMEARPTTLKAEELESSLGAVYPTFVMPMLQSHVTGFWLGLPGYLCRRHLPNRDDTVTLIDEEGVEYPTMYLSRESGLSGGWRIFSIAHGLVDGDALVFQLIRPTAFKVYIIRVKGFEKGRQSTESMLVKDVQAQF